MKNDLLLLQVSKDSMSTLSLVHYTENVTVINVILCQGRNLTTHVNSSHAYRQLCLALKQCLSAIMRSHTIFKNQRESRVSSQLHSLRLKALVSSLSCIHTSNRTPLRSTMPQFTQQVLFCHKTLG